MSILQVNLELGSLYQYELFLRSTRLRQREAGDYSPAEIRGLSGTR